MHLCFALAVVGILGVGFAALDSTRHHAEVMAGVQHSLRVQTQVLTAQNGMMDAESAHRAHLLTGNTEDTPRFDRTRRDAMLGLIEQTRRETLDNPPQSERLARMAQTVSARFAHFAEAARRLGAGEIAWAHQHVTQAHDRAATAQIKSDFAAITAEEKQLSAARAARANDEGRRASAALALAILFSVVVVLAAWRASGEQLRMQRAARLMLHESRVDAERALRSRTLFLAKLSHELRTPLNSILGMSEILSESPLSAQQKRYLAIFRRAGANLANLVNDILDFTRLDAGVPRIERCRFSLAELVDECSELISFRAGQKGLRFDVEFGATLSPYVEGDPTRIKQILLNLLSNGVKFTPAGEVSLRVAPAGPDEVEFTVRDSGPGIAAEHRAGLFEEFNQLGDSVTREHGGTGLGLAISRRLARLMGGELELSAGDAATLGTGATFRMRLPLPAAEAPAPRAEVCTRHLTPLRILVVDDLEDNRLIVGVHLRKLPFELHYADGGESAVQLFAQAEFDLVLMDLHMPGVDGCQATTRIRDYERERGRAPVPIVALTAFASDDETQRAAAAGCTSHLCKPISRAQLIEHILLTTADVVIMEEPAHRLLPKFLENRRREFAEADGALARADFAKLRSLGHSLKGVGGSYGFFRLSVLAQQFMRAAEDQDLETLRELRAAMADHIARARVRVRAEDETVKLLAGEESAVPDMSDDPVGPENAQRDGAFASALALDSANR